MCFRVCDVLDVARARGLHQYRGSGTADTARLPLEGLSAFGGGRKDCEIRTGRYPTTRRSGRCENSWPPTYAPRFRRTGSSHSLLGTYLGPTRGAGGGHVQNSNAASCRPRMPDVFDVARARGLHQHRGSGTADTARLPLEGLSAFGGGRKDCKIATGRYPTTRRSGRHEILGPRSEVGAEQTVRASRLTRLDFGCHPHPPSSCAILQSLRPPPNAERPSKGRRAVSAVPEPRCW